MASRIFDQGPFHLSSLTVKETGPWDLTSRQYCLCVFLQQDPEEEEMDLSKYVDGSKWHIVDTVVEPTYFVETGYRYTSINNKFIMVSKARATYVEIILVPSALLALMPVLFFLLPITGTSRSYFGKLVLFVSALLTSIEHDWVWC
jgi:hypothetical protein